MSQPPVEETPGGPTGSGTRWTLPLVLIALTFLSTFYVGAFMVPGMGQVEVPYVGIPLPSDFLAGWAFSLPLMAILLAHEFGHFIAGKIHGVDISPPYFIPMPIFLLGTMGAVIRMRGRIRTRNALLDVGAAGPLAGLAVCLPILVWGLVTSPVEPLLESNYIIEGRSVLYLGLLWLTKGPIPEGYDIMLNPTAFAGWAGLLVTMINLLPVGQLDGGHVAFALLGQRQNAFSERLRRSLPVLAVVVGLAYAIPSWLAHESWEIVGLDAAAGLSWLVWAGVLWLMVRMAGREHPPTGPEPLSPRRRTVAIGTLLLFVLLFMPSWARQR